MNTTKTITLEYKTQQNKQNEQNEQNIHHAVELNYLATVHEVGNSTTQTLCVVS